MILDELKMTIENQTGIPVRFLTGETAEESIAQAKAFLAYKREQESQRPKSPKEQFSEWMGVPTEIDRIDERSKALDQIAEQERVFFGGYPNVRDGGEVQNITSKGNPQEEFNRWFSNATAFNPHNENGWININ